MRLERASVLFRYRALLQAVTEGSKGNRGAHMAGSLD